MIQKLAPFCTTHLPSNPILYSRNSHIGLSIWFLLLVIQPAKISSISGDNEFYPDERDGLLQLRDSLNSSLNLHSIWTGPPCLIDHSNWVGISCSKSHVIQVVLEGVQLMGSLPGTFLQNLTYLSKLSLRNNSLFGPLPSFVGFFRLQFIFLSDNRFSGSIPVELVLVPNLVQLELQENLLTGAIPPFDQPTLTVFNVSNNFLEGQIPNPTVLQRFSESSFDHNLGLCGRPLEKQCPIVPTPPCRSPSKAVSRLKQWMIALIAMGAMLLPFVVMLIFLSYKRRGHWNPTRQHKSSGGGASVEMVEKKIQSRESKRAQERRRDLEFLEKERPAFNLDDLLRSSAVLMGEGKLGHSYKIALESGSIVAVKRLKEMNELKEKEFVQQMQLLGKIRHEHLVEIIAFYFSKEEKLVVYEYVPDGSLFQLPHENRGAGRVPLNWESRLSIIKGVARGLAYLHHSLPSHKVPHANLKSSNVLILQQDHSHHPKLTDFGFQPLLSSPKSTEQKLAIAEAPEFSQGKKLTHKADVYCFGILVLEVITGRNPNRFVDLCEWVRSVMKDGWSMEILDLEIMKTKEGRGEMQRLIEVALECSDAEPEKRPEMSEVVKRIEEINPAQMEN